jgi:hypothetical protein
MDSADWTLHRLLPCQGSAERYSIVIYHYSFCVIFSNFIWNANVVSLESPKEAAPLAIELEAEEEDIIEELPPEDEPQESKDARELLKKGEKVDDVVMADTQWTKLFKEFMGLRMCEEGFYFYQEVVKFKTLEEGLIQAEFARIRQKFIGSGAPFQVNIPDHMVKTISARADAGPVGVDIFDDAFTENRKVLATDVFPAWKAWKKTKDLVGKLKAATDPANWPKTITRRKSTRVKVAA